MTTFMTRLQPIAAACAIGALLGLFFTLSPMTLWFSLAMVALFTWAGRGLGRRERVWLFGLLGTGVALRLLALAAFFFFTRQTDGSFVALIPDETHIEYRAHMLRYIALGFPIGPDYVDAAAEYGWSGIHYPHALLQLLAGDAPYSIRLFDVALYLGACVTLFRMVRPSFGALASLGGLAVVLFQPSLFVWSITFLKETPTLFLTAVSLGAAVLAVRSASLWSRVLWCAVAGAAVLSTGSVRPGGDLIVGSGLAIGIAGVALVRRPRWLPVVLIVCIAGGVVALQSGSVRQRATELLIQTAEFHRGFINTSGWNYKVLDPPFYQRLNNGASFTLDDDLFTPAATARYVIRGVTSVFWVPLPWSGLSPTGFAYLPEHVLGNLLLPLAFVGVVAGLRRDSTVSLLLAGVIVLGTVMIGMTSGNIGTLIRHRSIVAFLLPWLSSLGACEVMAWVALRCVPAGGAVVQHEWRIRVTD